jgi:hypothetical protein
MNGHQKDSARSLKRHLKREADLPNKLAANRR